MGAEVVGASVRAAVGRASSVGSLGIGQTHARVAVERVEKSLTIASTGLSDTQIEHSVQSQSPTGVC